MSHFSVLVIGDDWRVTIDLGVDLTGATGELTIVSADETELADFSSADGYLTFSGTVMTIHLEASDGTTLLPFKGIQNFSIHLTVPLQTDPQTTLLGKIEFVGPRRALA